MDILQAYYEIPDITNDTFDYVGGFTFNSPPTAAQLVAMLPAVFSIEKDSNGFDTLCCAKIDGQDMEISVNSGAYIVHPIPFTPVHILGPHPGVVVVLKPCPRK